MLRPALILPLSVCLLFAAEPVLQREGPYWIAAETGSVPVQRGGKLSIRSDGAVMVTGYGAGDCTYVLKRKVRARSEPEARRLLRAASFRSSTRGENSFLQLSSQRNRELTLDLQVKVRSDIEDLVIDTVAGDLQVYDVAGSVDAKTGGGYIQMDRIGRNVSARTAGGEIRFGRIAGAVHSFSGGGSIQAAYLGQESWLETAGGEIYIHDAAAPVHVSTGGGNIRVEQAAFSVSARTSGGRIDVHKAGGAVIAGNNGGSIQVGSASGVQCESNGGSIRLRGAWGALRAATDVGNIFAELLPDAILKDSVLTSSGGDITVFIPASLPLTVRAMNESASNGRIISDFMEIPVRRAGARPIPAYLAEGALNGGGPVLKVSSSGGTIYLRRVGR